MAKNSKHRSFEQEAAEVAEEDRGTSEDAEFLQEFAEVTEEGREFIWWSGGFKEKGSNHSLGHFRCQRSVKVYHQGTK